MSITPSSLGLNIGMVINKLSQSPKIQIFNQHFIGTWKHLGRDNGYTLEDINWQCTSCGKINCDINNKHICK